MKKSNISMKVIAYTFLIIMAIIFVMPMLFTIISSLKTKLDIFSDPFALPKNPQWSNYVIAWKDANMSAYFINSVIQSGSTVILTSLISTMAAYALARFDFKLNKVLVLIFMLGMMVPMHTILVPVSYIIGLLEEAAIIDGANYFQIYSKIMIPLTLPAISTISIFNFMGAWNNILFPLLFINDKRLRPISLGLLNFNGERGSEYGLMMAGIVITVAVPLAIYLLFQEKVESGLAAGAVKE